MHVVLGVVFGGFVLAGVIAAIRGFTMGGGEDKSLPVLMYVIAVPLIIFGATGVGTLIAIAGE